jgi:Protein of unknown function (DUF3515)
MTIRRPRTPGARSAAVGVVLLLAGCSAEPVAVSAPDLTAAEESACAAFIADLPDQLAGQEQREIEPAEASAAAWGDPPMIVTCGGEMPPEFTDDSGCEEVADIGWFVPDEQLKDQSVTATITSIGIEPVISVELPVERRGDSARVLTDLAGPIKAHLTANSACV